LFYVKFCLSIFNFVIYSKVLLSFNLNWIYEYNWNFRLIRLIDSLEGIEEKIYGIRFVNEEGIINNFDIVSF
jgi:hypothetical protein